MWPFKKETKVEQIKKEMVNELETILKDNNVSYSQGSLGSAVSRYISGGYDYSDRLHQIFCDFGYPESLDFNNFWNMFRRFGVAKTVCNTMPDICWSTHPVIEGSSAFNSGLEQLIDNTNLFNRMRGLDKRQRVGAYAGAFIEVRDDAQASEPMKRVSGVDSIANIKPIYEGQLVVNQYDGSGNPLMYQYQPNQTGTRNPNETKTLLIHPSRLIMWAEGADDGSIYGISELESIFNDLMDLRKVSGAGAEGSYQNSRSIPIFTSTAGFSPPTGKSKEAFDDAMEEFLGKYSKRLVLNGLEPKFNNVTMPNPKETYNVALSNIAAGSGLPQAWIIGQITGVLAGNKDFAKMMLDASSRRVNFLDEGISQFIDWFIMYGVLPVSEYEIEWDDLLAASDDDKIKLAMEMAKTNRENFLAGQGAVFTEEEIREAAGFVDGEEFELPEEPEDVPENTEE